MGERNEIYAKKKNICFKRIECVDRLAFWNYNPTGRGGAKLFVTAKTKRKIIYYFIR